MLLTIHFLYPGFLYGLFALVIPVLLHLFSLKRYKKVYFSNFNFLQALQQQKKNSSKLKNLLLLLLRLIVITAVVIAFANPYTAPEKATLQAEKKAQVVIYLDNSFSMSNTGSKGSLLEEAKRHLFDIVSSYPSGTTFSLLTNDNSRYTSATKEEVISLLGNIKMSPASKRLSDIFKETGVTSGQKKTTLFLLSDFQKSNCDFQSITPDSLIEPVFLVLKPENQSNLYIKDIRFGQALHKKNQNDLVSIRVINSSEKDFNNVPVNLTINGKKKSVNKINVPANSEQSIDINYLNTENGFYKGLVEITDFPVIFDNKYYFSYNIGEQIKVLCIEQSKHTPYFRKLFADSTDFSITYTNVNQTANINFKEFNLIILDQISNSTTGLESALENYVTEGGNLFILPGDQTSANVLNKLLQKMKAPQFIKADTNTVIAQIEEQSAIFRDVFEKSENKLVLPYARKFYQLQAGEHSEKLLSDKKGNTLFASYPWGKGNIYLSAFNYNTDNSDMVYHPLFVPIMINMAYNVNQSLNTSWTLNSDAPIIISNKTINENMPVRIRNEEGTFEFIPEIRKDFSGNLVILNPRNIQQAGLYEVIQNDQLVDVIACNYDRTESQLQFSDEQELQKYFPNGRVENIKTTQLDRNSDLIKEIVLEDNNKYLSGWFLLLAAIALLLEQWIWRKKLM